MLKPVYIIIPDTPESINFCKSFITAGVYCLFIGERKWFNRFDFSRNSCEYLEIDHMNEYDDDIELSILEYCYEKKFSVLGIQAFSEKNVTLRMNLEFKLNIRLSSSLNSVCFRDKFVMRQISKSIPKSCPHFFESESWRLSSFSDWLNNINPSHLDNKQCQLLLVKPRKSWSSQNIKIVKASSLIENSKYDLNLKEYLIEQYINGDLFHVGAVTLRGRLIYSGIVRHFNPTLDISLSSNKQLALYTIDQHSDEAKQMQILLYEVIQKFKISTMMLELEVLKDRQTGQLYICEIAACHVPLNRLHPNPI